MLVPQLTERLREAENESMAKIAELEKQLSQARKELETLRVRLEVWAVPGLGQAPKNRLFGISRLDTSRQENGGSLPGLPVGDNSSPGAHRSASASPLPWVPPDVRLSLKKCLPSPRRGPRPSS